MSITTDRKPGAWLQILSIVLGVAGLVAYAASKFSSSRTVIIVAAVGLLAFVMTLMVLAVRARRFWPIVKVVAGTSVAVLLGTYLVLFPLIYLFQDAIADQSNAFFQPHGISEDAALALATGNVEAIDLTTPDGARLRGWLVRNSSAPKAPLLIFFDGSGSESSEMIPYFRRLDGWSVALVNYRGFAPSTGTPSHAHALADATLIYDTLVQRPDVDAGRVATMGYSLGTGVAAYLSAQRPITATVLVAPYDSLTLIGLKRSPIYAPLAGIMHRYFDSLSQAPDIHNPLLCLIGSADNAVPPDLSLKLAGNWGGETTVKTYEGEGHELLRHQNDSWGDIAAFLQAVGQD